MFIDVYTCSSLAQLLNLFCGFFCLNQLAVLRFLRVSLTTVKFVLVLTNNIMPWSSIL